MQATWVSINQTGENTIIPVVVLKFWTVSAKYFKLSEIAPFPTSVWSCCLQNVAVLFEMTG